MNTERPDHARDATEDADGPVTRRRRSRAAVASVATAVLLVGGGAAYLAATASGTSGDSAAPGGDGTPLALALDGYGDGRTPVSRWASPTRTARPTPWRPGFRTARSRRPCTGRRARWPRTR
ncbi:hypothetical protein ACFQ0G_34980 [Streptomyces chiangmaiensis]